MGLPGGCFALLLLFYLEHRAQQPAERLGAFDDDDLHGIHLHLLVYAIVCRLPKKRHPSARVKTTSPLPPVQESSAVEAVNSLLTPSG